jgi:hypothetical protein
VLAKLSQEQVISMTRIASQQLPQAHRKPVSALYEHGIKKVQLPPAIPPKDKSLKLVTAIGSRDKNALPALIATKSGRYKLDPKRVQKTYQSLRDEGKF